VELTKDKAPSKAAIQELINRGLAVRNDDNIEVPMSATHEEVVDLLSEQLSGPMAYFEQIGPTVFTDPISGFDALTSPPWMLLGRNKQRLEIVHVVRPTGKDLYLHRGPKNMHGQRYIILGQFIVVIMICRDSPSTI
jgi:hypothetical protein